MTRQASVFLKLRVSRPLRHRLLATALAGLGLTACGPESASRSVPNEPIAASEIPSNAGSIRDLLRECDVAKLTVALQDVLGLPDSAEALGVLSEVWADRASDPAAAACMEREVVRVYVANALAQAQANRMIEFEQLPSVLDALRAALGSRVSEVVQIALMGLGDFLTADDVERVARIAVGPNPANARVAVSALATSCIPAAAEALDRMAEVNGVLERDEVRVIRERTQEAHRIKCGQ